MSDKAKLALKKAKEAAKAAAKAKAIAAAKERARAKVTAGQTPTAEESAAAGEGATFTLGSAETDAKVRKFLPWVIGAGLLFLIFKRKR